MKLTSFLGYSVLILLIGSIALLLSRYIIRKVTSIVADISEARRTEIIALAELKQEICEKMQANSLQVERLTQQLDVLRKDAECYALHLQALAKGKYADTMPHETKDADRACDEKNNHAQEFEAKKGELPTHAPQKPIQPLPLSEIKDDYGLLALLVANGAIQYKEAFDELTQCRVRVSNFERVANNVTDTVYFGEVNDGEYAMSKKKELVPSPEIFNGYADSSMAADVWLLRYVFPGTKEGIVTEIQCAALEKTNAYSPYVLKSPGKLVT